MQKSSLKALFSLLTLSLSLSAFAADSKLINGAGASFPFPLYSKWFSEFEKSEPTIKLNYQSIGSSGGITQFLDGTIDFGATDAPMTDEQISKSKNGVLHIPTALGAVVVTYNIPNVSTLNLTGENIADLFSGKIKKWNDAELKKSNPKAALPDLPVLIVHRSDGSGTTAIFTEYLGKASANWKTKFGAGAPTIDWAQSVGGKGNDGVTSLVKQTPGAIGYVELIYAKNNALPYANVKNKSGNWITPSTQKITAAAEASLKSIPEDFRVSITDSSGKEAYPISGFTYLLIQKNMNKEIGTPIKKFVKWGLSDGQKLASSLEYAPLPASLAKKALKALDTVQVK